jgi:hypothetical protein
MRRRASAQTSIRSLMADLSAITAGMSKAARVGVSDDEAAQIRKAVEQTLSQLEVARWSWWATWRTLARYIQPRLGRFQPAANSNNRGAKRDQSIVNNTATISSQRFGAGMLSGATSPSRPWFKLRLGDGRGNNDPDAAEWLDEVTARMMHVLGEGNFYRSIATLYEATGVFGTAVMLMYEDFEDVIRFYPIATGEYYLANDHRGEVCRLYRKFVMTVGEMVGRWGSEVVSQGVKAAYDDNNLSTEIIVCHAVEPNDDRVPAAAGWKGMAHREVYWEWGQATTNLLEIKGFHEKPFVAPRWNVESNDAYGRSPGMDALGDVIQIQVEEKEKAKAIQKVNNPPMVADVSLRNQPASVIPGHVTWLPPGAAATGFKPAYQINPNIDHYIQDIERCEQRVKSAFYEDLFLAISQMEGIQPKNELELTERKAEKLVMLGPPLQRQHNELLKPATERTFAIMLRAGLLPPAPKAMHGKPLSVEFVSDLARAQKAADSTAIEQVFGFAGRIAAISPQIMDNLDADKALADYADVISLPSNIIVPADQVAAIRQGRALQARQAQALQTGLAAAQGAQTLSQTDVGGGENALQRMIGGGQPQ